MKKPKLDRGPKLNSAIAQPQIMITSGVRQLPADGRRLAKVAAMQIPRWLAKRPTERSQGLMHSHGNPNRQPGEKSPCNAAMQIRDAGSASAARWHRTIRRSFLDRKSTRLNS